MERTFIIAEVGSNHQGDLLKAIDFVSIAAHAGCDAVKFQLIPPFEKEWIDILIKECELFNIEFMATPFNQAGIDALKGKVKHWKIASTEAADPEFVYSVIKVADGDPIFISDGALDKLEVIQDKQHPLNTWLELGSKTILLSQKVNLIPMACVVKYPAKEEDYHFLSGTWGISDHTENAVLPVFAVASGATVVEKHITDDKTQEGPDHAFAIEPDELKVMVNMIRLVETIKGNKKQTITTHVGRKLQW